MSKKKNPQKKSPDVRKRILNKRFIDKAYITTKKILSVYGFDPDIFDKLSKYQRGVFLHVETEAPKFKVVEGNRVPRQLVNMVNNSVQQFMRNNYYGDESIGLTYLDLATFGVSLNAQILCIHDESDRSFPPEQMKIVDAIAEKFDELPVPNLLEIVGKEIRKHIQMISKVNFRVYGYSWVVPSEIGAGYLKTTVFLYSEESEVVYFQYKNQKHKAFRVKAGRVNNTPPWGAKIDHRVIFPERFGERYLDIYIQSHALLRVKERMDIFPAHKRNYYAMNPLLYKHRIVTDASGRAMFECYYEDTLFGYYPFTIQKNKIFILTFLPITSPNTPKGELLVKRFGIQKEDMSYLGMDKLSFFFTVDFSQIPILHEALLEIGLESLVNFAPSDRLPFEIDVQKTLRIKKFFENADLP
ncbi:MAG: hypothetical protein LBQ64_03065 [Bacteroidales bacterium]|jgi:hypothetical protein|nr:hypothetical protein [Bacteroidales bacterium]